MHLLQRQVPSGQCELSAHDRMASASVPQQHIAIVDVDKPRADYYTQVNTRSDSILHPSA